MAVKSVIYKILSKQTGKIYVGSAVNFSQRKSKHLEGLNKNTHPNKILQNHVNKYGMEDLEFSILESIPQREDLIKREQHYLDHLCPEFNICKIAGSALGRKWSESMRAKMVGRPSPMLGKKHSEESRRKISEENKGKSFTIMTDEIKAKLAIVGKGNQNAKGHKVSMEARDKMSDRKKGIPSGRKGKKLSEEHRKKLSEARKAIMTPELKDKIRRQMTGSKRGSYKKEATNGG